ncbi:MAG: SURF1 family protein [Pseudomonadales bacterium]|nr:SURF1 family protein [Pseudomonadales bacterium]
MLSMKSKKLSSLIILVGILALFSLLLWLGFWQLERAAYKRSLEDRYFDSLAMRPLKENALQISELEESGLGMESELAFRQLRLRGQYLPGRNFLIDNQLYKGQPGYRLVSAFRSAMGNNYLVDRGWLAAEADRSNLPVLVTPEEDISILNVIWPNLGLVPLLKDLPEVDGWPKRIQRVDLAHMQDMLGLSVFPNLLRLEKLQPGVLIVLTQNISFSGEKHTGYAVQWFGLAITLLVGLIVLYRKKNQ